MPDVFDEVLTETKPKDVFDGVLATSKPNDVFNEVLASQPQVATPSRWDQAKSFVESVQRPLGPATFISPEAMNQARTGLADLMTPTERQVQDAFDVLKNPLNLSAQSQEPGFLAQATSGSMGGLNRFLVNTATDPVAIGAAVLGMKPAQVALGAAAPLINRGVQGLFGAQMASQVPNAVANVATAVGSGDVKGAFGGGVELAAAGLMGKKLIGEAARPGLGMDVRQATGKLTPAEIYARMTPEARAVADQVAIDALNPRNAQEVVPSRVPAAVDLQTQRGIRDAADALAQREAAQVAPETFGRTSPAPAMPTGFPLPDAVRAKLEAARLADQAPAVPAVEPPPLPSTSPVKPVEVAQPDIVGKDVISSKLFENMQGRTMEIPTGDLSKPSPHLNLVLGKGAPTFQALIDAGILEATSAARGMVGVKVKPADVASIPVESKPVETAPIEPVTPGGYRKRGLPSAIKMRQDEPGGSLANYDEQSKAEWLGGKPSADGSLTLYRATPTGEPISAGDYVTNDRSYAQGHIKANLSGKGKITSIKATLDDIYPADGPKEFWYAPKGIEKPVAPQPSVKFESPPNAPTIKEPWMTTPTETPAPQPESLSSGLDVVKIPIDRLSLSSDVPQFKADANERGIVKPLQGAFDRRGLAPIQVWRRLNGKLEVISGRHRLDLAQRTGQKDVPVQIHDEAKGFDAGMAAKLDAELNIRDEQGTVTDYANYFKNSGITEAAAKAGGLLARAKGQAGFSIARSASENLFALHQAGKVTDAQAEVIAKIAPGNEGIQDVGIREALKGKPAESVEDMMRLSIQRVDIRKSKGAQGDLFAFDDSAIRDMEATAKAAAEKRGEFRDQIRAVKGAAKNPEAAAKMGVDVTDPAGILKRVSELERKIEELKQHPELARVEAKPDFSLAQPESIAEQKARITAEVEAKRIAAEKGSAREKLLERAAKPLKGNAGDLGQGDLLQGPTDLFGLPAPKPVIEPPAKPIVAQEAGFPQGPGAKTYRASAKPDAPETSEGTGLKHAIDDLERTAYGFGERPKQDQQAMAKAWEDSGAVAKDKPLAGKQLADSLIANPRRGLTGDESALLLRHKVAIENALNDAAEKTVTAKPDAKMDARIEYDRLHEEFKTLLDAINTRGSEWGREGRWRQALAYEDYTFATQERRLVASKGGEPLTTLEHGQLLKDVAEHKALLEAEKKHSAAVEANQAKVVEEAVQKVVERYEKESAKVPNIHPRILETAERIVVSMEKRGEAASVRLKEKLARMNVAVDPTIILDLAEIGVAKFSRKVMDSTQWAKAMIDEYGPKIQPFLAEAYEASKKMFEADLTRIHPTVSDHIKRTAKKAATAEDLKAGILEKITAKIESNKLDEINPLVEKLTSMVIADGAKGWREVTDKVHALLTEKNPDLDYRDTMTAISGHGKFSPLSKDEISVAKRDVKGQLNEILKIQEVIARDPENRPLQRTGVEHKTPSDTQRRFTQIYNAMKRRFGVTVTDPETQLRSVLQARKTFYEHRMADMLHEIETQKRTVRIKSPSPMDAELDGMMAEYKRIKEEHDAIFPRPELTDAQKLVMAEKGAERIAAEWDKKLENAKRGIFDETGKPGRKLTSQKLEEIKAKAQAARDQVQEIKDANVAYQESLQIEALDKSAAEYERKAAAGEFSRPPASIKVTSPAIEAAKTKRDAARDKLAALRKASPEAKQAALDAANRAVDVSLNELTRQINEGDIAAKMRREPSVTSPELELKRAERDQLLKIKRELQGVLKPKKTVEEIQMQTWKTRVANRVAELEAKSADLEAKLASGELTPADIAKKVRKPLDISQDPVAMELKAKLAVNEQKFAKAQYQARQTLRTVPRKIWDGIKQTAQAYGNIFASFDFSAPRQALGFLLTVPAKMLTNPVRTTQLLAQSFGRYFTSSFSEKQYQIINQKIHNRPNALSGADKAMGIDYTSLDSHSSSKYEDAAHSVLDEWAQLPIKSGNVVKTAITIGPKLASRGVRGSNRGFATFLNSIRAGFADELLRTQFKDQPPTDIELRDVGYLVNLATGRGELGPRSGIRYLGIWSPNLLFSRIKTLTGAPFIHPGSARTKAIVTKHYAQMLMGGYLLWQVKSMFDEKKETDLASSDVGKIVRGNTRLDMWGGYQQVTVAGYRTATATTTTLKGSTKNIGAGRTFGVGGPFDMATKFYRSKLRPDWALMVNVLDRQDYIGRNTDITTEAGRARVAQSMVPIPLAIGEIRAVMKDRGFTEAMIDEALSAFGAGLSTYEGDERQR